MKAIRSLGRGNRLSIVTSFHRIRCSRATTSNLIPISLKVSRGRRDLAAQGLWETIKDALGLSKEERSVPALQRARQEGIADWDNA